MDHITRKDHGVPSGGQLDQHLARRMPRCVLYLQPVQKTRPVLHELGLTCFNHGHHAVGDHIRILRQIGQPGTSSAPMIEFTLTKDIARVWKSRHPAAILPPRIPTNMIDMKMGADHQIDLLRLHTMGRQIVEIGEVQHMKPLKQRQSATLAPNVVDGFDLRAVCLPVLNALATEFQLTAFLSVYEETGAVCLERVHDMKGLEVRWWSVGGALPLNCGGAPKLLLAYQAQTEIDRAVAGPLPSLTARSITDEHRLREELTKIRARGWELAIDDVVVGLSAVAVPVLGRDNKPICAISLAGLTPQMQDRGKPLHLKPLIAAASTIAARLSGAEGGSQI